MALRDLLAEEQSLKAENMKLQQLLQSIGASNSNPQEQFFRSARTKDVQQDPERRGGLVDKLEKRITELENMLRGGVSSGLGSVPGIGQTLQDNTPGVLATGAAGPLGLTTPSGLEGDLEQFGIGPFNARNVSNTGKELMNVLFGRTGEQEVTEEIIQQLGRGMGVSENDIKSRLKTIGGGSIAKGLAGGGTFRLASGQRVRVMQDGSIRRIVD